MTHPDATPTPPSSPRERESEKKGCAWCSAGYVKTPDGVRHAGCCPTCGGGGMLFFPCLAPAAPAASLPPSAGTINSSRTDSSLIDAPPSAETREPEPDFYTERGAAERDALAEVLRFANGSGGWSAVVEAIRAGPTSAGSGETGRAYRELDEAMTMIDEQRGGIEGMRRNARIARQVIRTLAAHPAGTTRAEEGEWIVHNHGSEDGPGLACREYRVNGRLLGACLLRPATPTTEEP